MPWNPWQRSDTRDNVALGGVPAPLLFVGAFIVGLALHRIVRLPIRPRRLARKLGIVMAVGGLGIVYWAVSTMQRAETSPNPHNAVSALIEDGPFAYSRNPIYVGFALVHAGAALMVNVAWPLLVLHPMYRLLVRLIIAPEEAYMERRFGNRYREYKEDVPRWL